MVFSYLLLAGMAVFSGGANGQTMYRCGNTFSQQPCGPDSKQIGTPPAPKVPSYLETLRNDYEKGTYKPPSTPVPSVEDPVVKLAKIREKLYEPVADTPPSLEVVNLNKKLCEKQIRGSMKDPDAAKIKGVVRTGASNSYADGKIYPAVTYHLNVNGKNSFGAYTGEKQHICEFTLDEKTLIRTYEVGPYPG